MDNLAVDYARDFNLLQEEEKQLRKKLEDLRDRYQKLGLCTPDVEQAMQDLKDEQRKVRVDEARNIKISKAMTGKKTIHNIHTDEQKVISSNFLTYHLKNGWSLGRLK